MTVKIKCFYTHTNSLILNHAHFVYNREGAPFFFFFFFFFATKTVSYSPIFEPPNVFLSDLPIQICYLSKLFDSSFRSFSFEFFFFFSTQFLIFLNISFKLQGKYCRLMHAKFTIINCIAYFFHILKEKKIRLIFFFRGWSLLSPKK